MTKRSFAIGRARSRTIQATDQTEKPRRQKNPRPANAEFIRLLTEEELGENIRTLCSFTGWKFYWLRKTMFSSKGILDLLLVPVRLKPLTGRYAHLDPKRRILHRELKGYTFPKGKPRIGKLTPDQVEAIELINAAGGDAALWEPEDWFSGRIKRELI